MADLPQTGACFNCGFLCRRDTVNRHRSDYTELTEDDRRAAKYYRIHDQMDPWCFRGVDIDAEVRKLSETSDTRPMYTDVPPRPDEIAFVVPRNQVAPSVFTRDRQCQLWMEQKSGLGPEAHFGGLAMQELEQRRIEFERHMEAERQKFQLGMEESRREWETSQAARAEAGEARSQRVGHRLAAGGVFFAVAQVVVALIGLWIATTSSGVTNNYYYSSSPQPAMIEVTAPIPATAGTSPATE